MNEFASPDYSQSEKVKALSPAKKLKVRLLALLAKVLFYCLRLTYRITYVNRNHFERAKSMHSRGGYILPIWHEHHWSFIGAHPSSQVNVLISASTDGEIINSVVKSLGFKTVRGSTNKGGMEASDVILQRCLDGEACLITIDGPRGPRRKAKSGAIVMSRDGRLPLLPTVMLADRYWEFNSWDRMKIPKPFANIKLCYGEPFIIEDDARGLRFAKAKQRLGESLENLQQIASIPTSKDQEAL